ncbi:MAG: ACP phosphodiesterase [Saprospiraceae bacterium]
MNHTAHCFLSYPDEHILIGNFIGDYIKGRDWEDYAPAVQRGMLLHRTIDSFTDNHPAVKTSTKRIRPFAGRYAAPLVDILYDHLLCIHWERYAPMPFNDFAQWAYLGLDMGRDIMPASLQKRWPEMRAGHFLDGYRTREGLEWVLGIFARRLPEGLNLDALLPYFFENIEAFSSDFAAFFPELQRAVEQKLAANG